MHSLGLLAMRIAAGVLFAAHGYAKLFGGEGKSVHARAQRYLGDGFTQAVARGGPSNFARGLERMGVPAPRVMAFVVGGTEFVGGVLLVFGFLTRPVALGLAVNMVFAIKLAHWKQGLIGSASGSMYALSLLGSMLGLLFLGAGAISADGEARRRHRARMSQDAGAAGGAGGRIGLHWSKSRIGIG